MGKGYLDDWDKFENWQKTGYKETGLAKSNVQYDLPWGSGGNDTFGGKQVYHSCYLTHPPLTIPGTDKVIYGGSCSSPVVKDADVYIGFDWGMRFGKKAFPWNGGSEFLFEIKDMNVPDDPAEFKKMVTWTLQQLDEGKKVHCGCIGGHGRTGTFLAALCAEAGEQDAITYVRKNYCKKAVESTKQAQFLTKHFGITAVEGYKDTASYKAAHTTTKKGGKGGGKKGATGDLQGVIEKFSPMEQPFSLVGRARRN